MRPCPLGLPPPTPTPRLPCFMPKAPVWMSAVCPALCKHCRHVGLRAHVGVGVSM